MGGSVSGRLRRSVEPRPRVERITGWLASELRSISTQQAKVFLARVLYGATFEVIAEKLGVPPKVAQRLVTRAAWELRHPLLDRQEYLDTDGPTLLIDEGLRALIREWQLEEMFASECRQCGHPGDLSGLRGPRAGRGGRPRQYCSNACRQKAYRERRR
ncbi:sigma factor-like helix-turn-helix DNA-binding protein [Streptomyces sp. NPDC058642]|uniref:sigma factor-like helix-turn-helix DNA-binding protein n=1 Tax=Streptomyces sp. NPDC058642 TaxID=3346572 RepID=UPI00365C4F36